jgi:hypothetical protein
MVFEGSLTGKTLSGKVNGPNGATWQWTSERAPSLDRKSAPKWGKPIALFNGKDLSGWKTSGNGKSEWKVENGILITPGEGPELINDSKFEDFKLHVEFNCGPTSNSGVYLRGRYEVQIETDSADEGPMHHTGSVYGFIVPTPELPRKANEWQTYDITLIGRRVTVVQNGQTVIDNKEISGITGGALDSHEGLPGPIYLQGSEKGHVQFRSIVIPSGKVMPWSDLNLNDSLFTRHPSPAERVTANHRFSFAEGRSPLDVAAAAIRGARHVYLTGIGSSWHAALSAGTLFSLGASPVYMQDAAELLEYATFPPDAAVIVIFAQRPQHRDCEIVAKLHESRTTVIGITNSADGPLASEAQFRW